MRDYRLRHEGLQYGWALFLRDYPGFRIALPGVLMQINVLRELRQRLGSVTSYDVDETTVRLGDILLQEVKGSLTLLRTDQGLLVSLNGTAEMPERCARCLREATVVVDIKLEEEYLPVVDAATGARLHPPEDDDKFRIGPDFLLDLREGLRQYVLMSEPLKPLCRPDCAGLCPDCGTDLNERQCECAHDQDARWGALAAIRVTEEKRS